MATRYLVVTANDIPVGDAAIEEHDPRPAPQTPPPGTLPVHSNLPYNEARKQVADSFEQQYVEQILAAHQGNVSRAATAAGLPRKSLARIMKRHDILAGPQGTGGRPGRPRTD